MRPGRDSRPAPRRAAASGWRRPGSLARRLAGVVVLAAGAAAGYAGQGLIPGAGVGPLQALPLAGDPGAVAQGLVDGVGGGADGGLDVLPRVVVQRREVAAPGAEDLRERADVEPGVGAGGLGRSRAGGGGRWSGAAAGGRRPAPATCGGPCSGGRPGSAARRLPGVAQVKAGVVPVEPRDPGQRLAGRGREAFLPVLLAAAGVQDDRGGVSRAPVSSASSRWLASASRRAGLTILLDLPRSCRVCRRAGGSQAGAPQPRSGEDERAWRRAAEIIEGRGRRLFAVGL